MVKIRLIIEDKAAARSSTSPSGDVFKACSLVKRLCLQPLEESSCFYESSRLSFLMISSSSFISLVHSPAAP
jgi:hypothetical protein